MSISFHKSSCTVIPLTASVASAVGLATMYYYYNYWCHRRTESAKKFDPPAALVSSSSFPYAKELLVAIQLALQAGNNMIAYCNEKGTAAEDSHDLNICTKGQAEDFCTKIDVENEHLITSGILKHFPTHCIIGEESVGTGTIPTVNADTPTWIIDPIDGTTNFAAGLPLTCVSIGLCVNANPTLGVVFSPMTQELYVAVKGFGCYRNGVLITKRNNNETTKSLKEAVVCFEFGYARDKDAIAQVVGVVQRIMEHGCRTTRSLGSGVLDLCYVATGRLDVVYAGVAGEGWKPWDYCAGTVIAQEAGCCIEAIDQQEGQEFDIYSKSIICAVNKSLVDEVRSKIKDA